MSDSWFQSSRPKLIHEYVLRYFSYNFQVHPVVDSRQTLICYEKPNNPNANDHLCQTSNNRRPITPPPQNTCYPLAPNICVEAGRIQFVRRESDGTQVHQQPPPSTIDCTGGRNTNSNCRLSNSGTLERQHSQQSRVTITRGLQTEWMEDEEDTDLREMQVGGANRFIPSIYSVLFTQEKITIIKDITQ